MKQFLSILHSRFISRILLYTLLLSGSFISCKKSGNPLRDDDKRHSYPADVVDKWLTLQIRLFKDATGISNGAFSRPFAYAGITAFESSIPGEDSWKRKYNGLTDLPEAD